MKHADGRRWFWYGCLFELGIGLTGLVIAGAQGRLAAAAPRPSWQSVLVGIAATAPLLAAMIWSMHTPLRFLGEIQEVIVRRALPVFRMWSTLQLAVVSAVAGLSEEILFRFAVQGWLEARTGPSAAILAAGILFGLCHCINLPYALFTAVAGVYLGLVFHLTGSLITVAVAHALYDFIALVYLVRVYRVEPGSNGEKAGMDGAG
jgi:hypothetical protein